MVHVYEIYLFESYAEIFFVNFSTKLYHCTMNKSS